MIYEDLNRREREEYKQTQIKREREREKDKQTQIKREREREKEKDRLTQIWI